MIANPLTADLLGRRRLRCGGIRCVVDGDARPVRCERERDRPADKVHANRRSPVPSSQQGRTADSSRDRGRVVDVLRLRPGTMRLISPLSTRPGPISMNVVIPAAAMCSTHCTHRTGCVSWKCSSSPIVAASRIGRPRSLAISGTGRIDEFAAVVISPRMASAARAAIRTVCEGAAHIERDGALGAAGQRERAGTINRVGAAADDDLCDRRVDVAQLGPGLRAHAPRRRPRRDRAIAAIFPGVCVGGRLRQAAARLHERAGQTRTRERPRR